MQKLESVAHGGPKRPIVSHNHGTIASARSVGIFLSLLPEEREIALIVGLPKHCVSAAVRSHKAYSRIIKGEVKRKFQWLKEEIDEHGEKIPDYQSTRSGIDEAVSSDYFGQIMAAGVKLKRYKGKKDALDLIYGGN